MKIITIELVKVVFVISFCRRLNKLYKCIYSDLKDDCNATASAIYNKYYATWAKRFVPDCVISEYIF